MTSPRVCTLFASTESSYELEKYKQGAVTQAILEAFDNSNVSCSRSEKCKANQNGDEFITIRELTNFIEKRVPFMVMEANGAIQQPKFNCNMNEDLPIFWIEK